MKKENNPVYDRNTLEFVTVALEYCNFIQSCNTLDVCTFLDKATKILPLLYLKAALLPDIEQDDFFDPEMTITEEMYDSIRSNISSLLGEKDSYLDTFQADMQYSETPIIAFISENLADIYQDLGNFIFLFRQGNEFVMREVTALCYHNFCEYWGQPLLNALKAMHHLRYADDFKTELNDDND